MKVFPEIRALIYTVHYKYVKLHAVGFAFFNFMLIMAEHQGLVVYVKKISEQNGNVKICYLH